jgi:phosphoribosyl 1,2-cyclic phosphate phosphodiesterase
MNLTIKVLGTGTSQGIPVVACDCDICQSPDPLDKRLRSAVLVETTENTIVIDAGPDFRQQMLREQVKKLDAILITHDHKDHIAGIDDVRAFNWILKKPMEIYGRPEALQTIEKDFAYAFHEIKYPGVPQINLHSIENRPFTINNNIIIPILALHGKLPVTGFRIGDFTYLTDASHIEAQELDKIKGSKCIIINGLRKEPHHSHFTLDEAVSLLKILNPKQGFITHISHQMGLHSEVNKYLPPGISLAYDGLQINIS